jgi:hypothetical protein
MRAVERGEPRGSLKWIRAAVNQRPDLLCQKVSDALGLTGKHIEWVSPRADDEYAEYGDQDFLERLGIQLSHRPLEHFWPNRGPQWDALGRSPTGEVFLVEAKANVPEVVSPGTGASADSRRLIEQSLSEVKEFLRVDRDIVWSGRLYQYANRLAHLYLLRQLNAVPAYLIFVYFIGDEGVSGPRSVAEWKAALTVAKRVLGISERNPLGRYTCDVFIDVQAVEAGA